MDKDWQEFLDKDRYLNLFDIYGDLLTDRLKEILSLYLNEDWSLTEISDYLNISRQAVYDSLQRGFLHLDRYEETVQHYTMQEDLRHKLQLLQDALVNQDLSAVQAILTELENTF